MIGNYEIVTLCGSTRFKDDFIRVQEELTLQGKIVISVGLFGYADNKFASESSGDKLLEKAINPKTDINDLTSRGIYSYRNTAVITESVKEMLDDMHKRKIDISDLIFIINKNGYIGKSTQSDIEYAISTGKRVEYMEPPYYSLRYWSNLSYCPKCNNLIPWDSMKNTNGYICECGAVFKCLYIDPTSMSIFDNPWLVSWSFTNFIGETLFFSTSTLCRGFTVLRYT